MANLAHLPAEIIFDILSNEFSYDDLWSLCLVNRRLNKFTTPILYKTVTIRVVSSSFIEDNAKRFRHGAGVLERDIPSLRLPNHSSLQFIRYFGLDVHSRDESRPVLYGRNHRIVANSAFDVLKSLGRDQLKGFLFGIAEFSDEMIQHLQKFQCKIESIYEQEDKVSLEETDRTRMMRLVLHKRTNFVDLTLNSVTLETFIPFCCLLIESQNTLRSLFVDLAKFDKVDKTTNYRLSPYKDDLIEALAKLNVDFHNPPKLGSIKRLYLRNCASRSDSLSSFFFRILEFSELDYLNVYNMAQAVELWDRISMSSLKLVSLHLANTKYRYKFEEKIKHVLLSFIGLKELCLDYSGFSKDMNEGILNHAASLQKLFWNLENQFNLNAALKELRDISKLTNLRELAISGLEIREDHLDFPLPPNLNLLLILTGSSLEMTGRESQPFNFVTASQLFKFIGDRFGRTPLGRKPFNYLALDRSRTGRGADRFFVCPFTVKVVDGEKADDGRGFDPMATKYVYHFLGRELLPMDAYFRVPEPMLHWMPPKTWRKLAKPDDIR
ncbi:hypothetical protein TWF694_004770 [Orbilia ellipsospora]|uniref:F-box domain-containing protein n=1 Tax=Orbilia ellipsospora TaxID=2528407 RepID=A0AAV9WX15_9PEZI